MTLVWKLLRKHISIGQLAGFFFANLFGMFIVLLAFQFYRDIMPIFTSEDSFMRSDYLIVSKQVGAIGSTSSKATFSNAEIDELSSEKFIGKLGKFTSTEYKVKAAMGINGVNVMNSDFFFESVPDEFVDVKSAEWQFKEGEKTVPIILPRSYITMYNFGFAQSRSLPKISEGLVGMIDFVISISGNGHQDEFLGKVIGFSSRLNTILVPQAFMDWSNKRYAPDAESNPSRLIIDVANPADKNLATYFEEKGYELEDDKLNTEKATYFLRLIISMVMIVGLIISILSFYILMLSIFLLVQKNSSKLENLLLVGYSPSNVAWPYQLLTILLNVGVLIIAVVALFFVRRYYLSVIYTLFPDMHEGTMLPAIILGVCIFVVVTAFNMLAIRHKILNIWKHKE